MTENRKRVDLCFVLGASDPEMDAIRTIAADAGCRVVLAECKGERVHAANAYFADRVDHPAMLDDADVVFVECAVAGVSPVFRCDHHAPGDRGFGKPPREYMTASSIGQVLNILADYGAARNLGWSTVGAGVPRQEGLFQFCAGVWLLGVRADDDVLVFRVPQHLLYIAAADHCLRAAYANQCRGVQRDALLEWRIESRAAFQGRSFEQVLNDVHETIDALTMRASVVRLGENACVVNMCRDEPWPELPEAACFVGDPYIAGPLDAKGGRKKFVCSGDENVINAFIKWAKARGLVDVYGDAVRGYAGAYLRRD